MLRRHIAMQCLLALFASTASAAQEREQEVEGTASAIEYEIIGEAVGAPSGCEAEIVGERLRELFEAMTGQQSGIAENFFGQRRNAPFRWFSITDRTSGAQEHWVTYSVSDIDSHFAQAERPEVEWVLRTIQFNRWDSARGLVHFGPITFERRVSASSTEVARTGSGIGKGAYHCATAAFVVLSIAVSRDAAPDGATTKPDPSTPNSR